MRSSPCRFIVVAVIVVLCLPGRAAAASKWTRLQTENFLFVGDAPERQIRQIAQRLEQFRDVMSRILPPAAVVTSTPTVVFVFQTDQSLTPYKPRFEGRPVEVAGYFLARREANYVTMNAASQQAALRIIFHEYAHFLVRNTTGDMPLWANEGLAGVYETFEERNNGKGAIIGIPNGDHLALLKNTPLMPLRELMSVDHGSAVYNEGHRRGVFYAESWALMHYLMFGSPARTAQLRDYLQRVKNGVAPEPAYVEAFGADVAALDRELRDYIRKFLFPVIEASFNERVVGAGAGRGSVMDDVDANAYLGELLSMLGRVDEARTQLKKLVELNPQSARAVGTLARLELEANNMDDAVPLFERAATLDPADAAVHRAWGSALFARSLEQVGSDPVETAARAQARTVLNRAVELSPTDAASLAMLGRLEADAGDYARATSLFERAVTNAPKQEGYRLMLAAALVSQQEYVRATTYLGPLVGTSQDPAIKESARNMLAFVGRQRARTGEGATATGARENSMPPSMPPPTTPSAPSALRPTATGGRFIPELRPVAAGEQRVLGMFTAVDCRPGAIVLVIETEGKTWRIVTEDLAKVTFITYRQTLPGNVECGPMVPAERVFATFGKDDPLAAGVDGRAIAIELLPDDFTPK